jgi:acetyl esterase/lipase
MADEPIQRTILRSVLSLPRPVLRLMSGGSPVYAGGRTLDPRLQFLAHQSAGAPSVTGLTPAEARAACARRLSTVTGEPEPGVSVQDLTIEGPGGALGARVYRPDRQDPAAPALVYAHMGGGVVGDLSASHVAASILAQVMEAPVVSVDYRLAPEHRFPAGLQDLLDAYRWTRDHAARFGAPSGRAAIGGEGVGGTFAAVVCQDLKRHAEPQPDLQLLLYPLTDAASETQSMTTYADGYLLSKRVLDWLLAHYLGPDADPADPRVSPIKAPDLSGLAPAVIATAGFDPLLDQGEAYAKRLQASGVSIVYRCYDRLAHGFAAYTGAVPAADIACREIAGLAREVIQGRLH